MNLLTIREIEKCYDFNYCKILFLLLSYLSKNVETRILEQENEQNNKLNKLTFSSIDYVNLLLFQFYFSNFKCHFIFNNFNNVNIKVDLYPIVLRRLELVQFYKSAFVKPTRQSSTWVPIGLLEKTNDIAGKSELLYCKNSTFLTDFKASPFINKHDICVRIHLPIYSAQSKPWNCQVEIHLLPSPDNLKNHFSYPRSFVNTRFESLTNLQMMLPSTRPDFVILVDFEQLYSMDQVATWITTTERLIPKDNDAPLITHTHFVLYRMRKNFIWDVSSVHVGSRGKLQFGYFNQKFIKQVEKGTSEEINWTWQFPGLAGRAGNAAGFHRSILHHTARCGNDLEFGHTNRAKLPLSENDGFNSRLYRGIALLWLSILGNYSYKSDTDDLCRNGKPYFVPTLRTNDAAKLVVILTDPARTNYFPLALNDSLQNMKFVSCGRAKGVEGFAFSEMHNIFDGWMWGCIATSTILVCLSLSWTLNLGILHKKVVSRVWHSIKIYLEQGGPYPDQVNRKSKPIIIPTLLVGIVISNAYKNANVYNLILPRKSVPYTDITELAADKYSIYTKAMAIGMEAGFLNNAIINEKSFNHSGKVSCKLMQHKMDCVSTHNPNIHPHFKVISELQFVNDLNSFNKNTKDGTDIKNVVELMPVNNVFNDMTNVYYIPVHKISEIRRIAVELVDKFGISSNKHLYQLLHKCKRTAAVMPEYWARKYEQKLKRSKLKNVFVGNDKYLDINHGFYLKGQMHRNVVYRMKAMKFSGIWDWWPKLAREYFDFGRVRDQQDVPTPSMNGNIQIIFYLLGICLTVASFVFIGESYFRIFSWIKILIKILSVWWNALISGFKWKWFALAKRLFVQ